MKEILKTYTPAPLLRAYGTAKRALQKIKNPTPKDEVVSFNLQTVYKGHFNVTYRGIPCLRYPFDYVMYQMIVSEIQPDLIIEIGTNYGGTALYFADLMDAMGHGAVHSIDVEDRVRAEVAAHTRITLFKNGWEGYDLANAAGYKKILVLDDASHMYEDVLGALQKFAPLVSVDSYFIVEDGIINEVGGEAQYHGGPLKAIREFLPQHPEFAVDRKYCDMFGSNATANINGYLKRIS